LSSRVVLITGGARSGKSTYAQNRAAESSPDVLFVATAEALDQEMIDRIAVHRRSRPQTWLTLEASSDIGSEIIRHNTGTKIIIVDCITLLINAVFNRCHDRAEIEKAAATEIDGLVAAFRKLDATFFIVTNEVGLGIVPDNEAARTYRDVLGTANQKLAAAADEVFLMVSGIPIKIKG
jgi:adenosylcobinamide kinase / adenosylcobinamide-phosphate guanylyltransferase